MNKKKREEVERKLRENAESEILDSPHSGVFGWGLPSKAESKSPEEKRRKILISSILR